MTTKVPEERIRSLMSTMHIEGFMVTEAQVREALEEMYSNTEVASQDNLFKVMAEPGADKFALMKAYVQRLAKDDPEP